MRRIELGHHANDLGARTGPFFFLDRSHGCRQLPRAASPLTHRRIFTLRPASLSIFSTGDKHPDPTLSEYRACIDELQHSGPPKEPQHADYDVWTESPSSGP